MTSHKFVDGTDIGLPAGMCVRCATLQTPEPSKCETEQLPTLSWIEPASIMSVLYVNGFVVADVVKGQSTGTWSFGTEPGTSLLKKHSVTRRFCSSKEEAKQECERFVVANLDMRALAMCENGLAQ